MGKLDGKVALVTGSSRSMGKAMAIGLAREGASLVLAARTAAGLEETARLVRETGSSALAVPTDVREENQITTLFDKTMAEYGRLDILVNNSGIFLTAPLETVRTEQWDDLMATSLRAPFLCTRTAFRIMKKQGGGRIINIGSISASRVRDNNTPYNCAKFGLVGLTHSTALEGRAYNITCSIVHPGLVKRDNPPEPDPEDKAQIMLPEEIAATVVYVACLPDCVNILELVQIPREQPYLGRG